MEKMKRYATRVFKRSTPIGEKNEMKEDNTSMKGEYINQEEKSAELNNFNFVTDFKEEKFSVTWHIQNIDRCRLKQGEFLESPVFSTVFCKEVQWTLRAYPKGKDFQIEKEVMLRGNLFGLFIHRMSTNPVASSFKYRFGCVLLNEDSQPFAFCNYPDNGVVEMEINSTSSSEYGTNSLFRTEQLKGRLSLLLTCDIFVCNSFNMGSSNDYKYTAGLSKFGTLFKDLKELYETGKFSEVTLKAGDAQFPVHKNILASRSKVFDAMFQHDMKETLTNVIEIDDIEPAVIKDMLQYIYTGSVNDFDVEKAISLYQVADKYSLEELKNWCLAIMLAKITVENVCKIAILADLWSVPKLKKIVFSVFRNNASDIYKSKEWKDLVEDSNHHALVSEILGAVTTNFVTNCEGN